MILLQFWGSSLQHIDFGRLIQTIVDTYFILSIGPKGPGEMDGSAGKDTLHQAWQPQFDLQDPHSGRGEPTPTRSFDLHTCLHTYMYAHAYKKVNRCEKFKKIDPRNYTVQTWVILMKWWMKFSYIISKITGTAMASAKWQELSWEWVKWSPNVVYNLLSNCFKCKHLGTVSSCYVSCD